MSARRAILVTLLAWIAMIGFDFLLHGGVLARLYGDESAFLLPPHQAFARIPLGYLSFLVLAILIVWLAVRLGVSGWLHGLRFGLVLGGLVWLALALGLLSITTAPVSLLVGWLIGQTLEMGVAGAFVGAALGGARLGRLFALVAAMLVACVVVTVVLQNVGWAPAMDAG